MNALVPSKPLLRQPTDDMRRPLAILFSAYPIYNTTTEDAAARTAAYLIGLSTLPEWAVTEAVTQFVQGKVERRNRDKLPTAEQVAAVARESVEKESERRRLKHQLDQQRREREAEREALASRPPADERAAQVARLLGRSIKSME